MRKIGYCCINLSLGKNIKTSRVKRGIFKLERSEFLKLASETALLNIKDLKVILQWNLINNITLFRVSSDMFPFWDRYEFEELPGFKQIYSTLNEIGDFVKNNSVRLVYHPGPYDTISTGNQLVAEKAIKSLNQHGKVFDLMGLDRTVYYPINIHVHNIKPDKQTCCNNFIENFKKLDASVQTRLTVENDDTINGYCPIELYDYIYKEIKIPILFDYFHYSLGKVTKQEKEMMEFCFSTWNGVVPLTHYSSSKIKEINDSNIKISKTAHSDYILEEISSYGLEFDCELEAKKKDLALLKYKQDYLNGRTTN